MYDAFSDDYDRFVNWSSRLAFEMPFIETQLAQVSPKPGQALTLLDAACGTGWHAIALAQRGHQVTGADLSEGMVDRAQANAHAKHVRVRFIQAGFDQLALTAGAGAFDAVLCLGNSLPHVTGPETLQAALDNFSACLRPAGLLLLQNRNFDAVLAERQRWMEPQAQADGNEEWLFLRFYDFLADGMIQFNIIDLYRRNAQAWQQRIHSTRLYPLLHAELLNQLVKAGFEAVTAYGDMEGSAFDARQSGNLVLAARKRAR